LYWKLTFGRGHSFRLVDNGSSSSLSAFGLSSE
jgi:hypothetical protein